MDRKTGEQDKGQRRDQEAGARGPVYDPTSLEMMRTLNGSENPPPHFTQHVSGSIHTGLPDLEDYLAPPESGSMVLPSTIPLLNTNLADPLQREAVHGVDIAFQDRERSTHLMVIGLTGTGKNVRVIDPLRASAIADPGQIVISLSLKAADIGPIREMCKRAGKRLVIVNLGNPERSIRWNPLETDDPDEARDLIRRFADAAKNPYSKGDSEFWTQWVRCGLQGCWEEGIRSFPLILEFFSQPYDRVIDQLKGHRNTSSNRLAEYLSGHSQNAETVMASILGTLTSLISRNMLKVLSKNELDLKRIFRKPVCLHIEINEAELETQRPMIQMLARCVIDNLISTSEYMGPKKLPATLFIDDLPSLGCILTIERVLTLRSRRVGIVAGVQSISSLELAYGPNARSFLEAFSHKIVLAGCSQPDADYFSHASGESFVILPGHEGQNPVFANRPLLSSSEIRRANCRHPLLDLPATLFFGPVAFQAYLQRFHEIPRFAEILRATRGVTGQERLRRKLPPCPTLAELCLKRPTGVTDTRGWDPKRLEAYIEKLLPAMGLPEAKWSLAGWWWKNLRKTYSEKPEIIVQFSEKLLACEGSLKEYYDATDLSETESIEGNLFFMQYLRYVPKDRLARKRRPH